MKTFQQTFRALVDSLNEMANKHGLRLDEVSVQWIDTSNIDQNSVQLMKVEINRGSLFYVPEEKP